MAIYVNLSHLKPCRPHPCETTVQLCIDLAHPGLAVYTSFFSPRVGCIFRRRANRLAEAARSRDLPSACPARVQHSCWSAR